MLTSTKVYNAGGGPGRKNIQFETLFEGQCEMYARTLNKLSDFQISQLEQEKRQISVVDYPVTIHINIAREDFPEIAGRIQVVFVPSAAQQAWEKLIQDACKVLKIDFIYSILDKFDKAPVNRILRLKDNGDYLVRQRETSAILEVINTGRTPVEVSWDITLDINNVKQSLALEDRNQPILDRRIAGLVSKPVTREIQRDITALILNAVSPKVTVGVIEQFHRQFKGSQAVADDAIRADEEEVPINFGDIAKYGDAIDIVSLHRLCLEKLARFAAEGRAKHVAGTPCFEYICNVIDALRSEVDVVAVGLKVLSDVMKYLVEERERVFHVVLDCIQAYAPPASKHRPRNPKRLRAPEDLYQESLLATSGTGAGVGSNAGQQQAHPSLSRYGDFYGHSAPAEKEAALHLSEEIKMIKLYDHTNTGAYNRLNRVKKDTHVLEANPVSADQIEHKEAITIETPQELEIKALVRGRVRVDHQAAAHALHTAFNTNTNTAAPGCAVAPSTSAAGKLKTTMASASDTAEESSEFIEQQKEFIEKQKRVQKYKFKFKPRGKEESSEGDGSNTGDELDKKKQWKGTMGVIGRKAPEKPKEVIIDFKKKIAFDGSILDNTDGEEGGQPGQPEEAPKTEEEILAAATEEADKKALAEALLAAGGAAAGKRKKKRHKFAVVPLPLVPCVVFRGLSGKSKQSLAMLQSFATLFKTISQNYGNRDVAFKMGVAEELSVVATVCQGMPRVLDYYIWTIDSLYRDGFGEISADELDIALEDYTMVLSTDDQDKQKSTAAFNRTTSNNSQIIHNSSDIDINNNKNNNNNNNSNNNNNFYSSDVGNTAHLNVHNSNNAVAVSGGNRNRNKDAAAVLSGEETSMTGFMFDTVSEMTVPTIDQDGLMSEATPIVNMGEPLTEEEQADLAAKARRATRKVSAAGSAGATGTGDGGESRVGTEDAIDENPFVPSNQLKKSANQLLINALGLFEFEARYVQRPADNIVVAVAMVSSHIEMESRERFMAQKWLDTWDDNSRSFKLLKKKGLDLAGMS